MERVDMYKAKLMNRNPNQKPRALKTVREKVTSFIGGELHSRQEHLPLVGRHINNAKCEPLHLKNNTTQQLFIEFFKIAYSQSLIDNVKNFSSIPEGCIFLAFMQFVRQKMSKKLFNCIRKWFNEQQTRRSESEMSFRFTGKETRNYLNNFQNIYCCA